MKFDDINHWFHFIKKSPIDELEKVITEDLYLDECLKNDDISSIEESMISSITLKLKGSTIEKLFWEKTLFYISSKSLSKDFINYLINNQIAIEVLGHMPLKDDFLWELVDLVDEAIITLGKRYYLESKYSENDFVFFLARFKRYHWLWNNLLNIDLITNKIKNKLLIKNLFLLTDFDDLKGLVIDTNKEKLLIKTKNIKLIMKYYNSKEGKFLKAIAQNLYTPIDVLKELVNINNVKFAKQIRELAKANLKMRNINDF